MDADLQFKLQERRHSCRNLFRLVPLYDPEWVATSSHANRL